MYTFTHEDEVSGTKIVVTYDETEDGRLETLMDYAIVPFLLGVTFTSASLAKIIDSEML